ncbi:DUF6765 family protein [Lachnospiraceae bacterium C1.1]|nr:hypothetical protein [Lachnospiraceae bacterium C1.1]
MQEDFHYYATYCAAFISGYSPEESHDIAYCAQLVDLCSKAFLSKIHGSQIAATTQLQLELAEARTDLIGLQDITRIWSSFHFLPRDLYAKKEKRGRKYMNKFRLICGPNGDLLLETVKLARNKGLQAVGLAMHVLADTWAHMYFAGTPSLVINNTDKYFYDIFEENGEVVERQIKFRHSASSPDDLEKSLYTNSIYQLDENSIMNLGHGRAGHLPDYSFAKYKYLPAWGDYNFIIKDNPSDYMHAFCQMIYAMKYLRGEYDSFEKEKYDEAAVEPYRERIDGIFRKRQLNSSADWKEFGRELSGVEIEDFDIERYQEEYITASKSQKEDTFLGNFIRAAIAQKGMVTNAIFQSKNKLAGYSKVKVSSDSLKG